MPVRLVMCLVFMALSAWVQADETRFAPLPAWSAEEQAILAAHPDTPLLLGGLLWPRGANGGLNVDPDLPILPEADLAPSEETRSPVLADSPDLAQPVADITGFLPPAAIEEPEPQRKLEPTPEHALRATGEEFAELCYAADPEHFVIDPSYHFTELEREDAERFLEYHAGDAKIRVTLLVIGRDEVLNKQFDFTRLAQGGVLRDNTALLVLPVGEPWRCRLFFSSNVHQGARPAELAEILSRVIEQGRQNPSREEQLHRMLVELSIQLFQLEQRLAPLEPKPVDHPVASLEPERLTAPELAEVFSDESLPAAMLRRTLDHAYAPWILYSALLLMAALVWLRWRAYRMRHFEWLLPDVEPAASSLGGEFSGGGVMIAYR